jgi:drug/metabolite transporter (DMT)-like permease
LHDVSSARMRTRELAAVGLMALGNVLFAFNDGWVRRIADDIGTLQTIWGRSIIFLALIALVMRRKDWRAMADAPKPHLQVVRGIFPVVAAFLMIEAMGRIPVADATATFFVSPLFTVLLAIPLLGERIGPEKWLALALGFAGMLIIVKPGTGALDWAHLFALATAFVVALYQIFTALVTRTSSAKTTLFFMAATATVITSCIVPITWTPMESGDWLHLAGVSIVYAVGHGMYIMAHARAEASKLAPFIYFQLVGSIMAGFVFYAQVPRLYTLLGAALIASGGCIALLRRRG